MGPFAHIIDINFNNNLTEQNLVIFTCGANRSAVPRNIEKLLVHPPTRPPKFLVGNFFSKVSFISKRIIQKESPKNKVNKTKVYA